MLLYLAWDGDHIGRQVGKAAQNDDVEGLRRISQAIDHGNLVLKAWVELAGGSLISMGGDEGRAEVPADKLEELEAQRVRYAETVGSPVSVGVGIKLSEAELSLIAAKLQGGDRVVFYTEEVAQQVEAARKQGEESEAKKLVDEYLHKAAPAMNPGENAGFSGAHPAAHPTVQKPAGGQGEHSEGEAALAVFNDPDLPKPAEATHAAADFERQLHDEAWKGEEEDMGEAQGKRTNLDQVKQQVAQALLALKEQLPVLEQVKQAAPRAYQAMMGLAHAVIGMAHDLSPVEPMAKAEPKATTGKPVQLVHYSVKPGLKRISVKHMGTGAPGEEYKQGRPGVARAYYYRAGTPPEHVVTTNAKAKYRAVLDPAKHRLYDVGKDPEGLRGPARERFLAGEADMETPEDEFLNFVKQKGYYGFHNSGSSVPNVVALFHDHPVEPMTKAEEVLGKMALVHNDPQRPVTIYRIQNKAGQGPYVGAHNNSEVWDAASHHADLEANLQGTHGATTGNVAHLPQPGPVHDFQPHEWGERENTQGLQFGFENPVHAREWFGNDALARMKAEGFELTPVKAKRVWRSKSGRQVVYEPHEQPHVPANVTPPPNLASASGRKSYINEVEKRIGAPPSPHAPVDMQKDELEKAKLPMPKASPHHEVQLPVGSQVDQKLKVQHQDGTTSWKQMEAGQIRSMDPAGHATSSRSPNSR